MQVAVSTQHDEALEHLVTRLRNIQWKHMEDINEKFNLDRKYPKNKEEAKKWFDEGKYYHDADDFDESRFHLYWGDKPDYDGAEKARVKMNKHYTLAQDIIRVKTDEDVRLKALHDFESATFH